MTHVVYLWKRLFLNSKNSWEKVIKFVCFFFLILMRLIEFFYFCYGYNRLQFTKRYLNRERKWRNLERRIGRWEISGRSILDANSLGFLGRKISSIFNFNKKLLPKTLEKLSKKLFPAQRPHEQVHWANSANLPLM